MTSGASQLTSARTCCSVGAPQMAQISIIYVRPFNGALDKNSGDLSLESKRHIGFMPDIDGFDRIPILLVIVLWLPFGIKTTGLMEEWMALHDIEKVAQIGQIQDYSLVMTSG